LPYPKGIGVSETRKKKMNDKLIAFVDGSHINGKIGYGVVIVNPNGAPNKPLTS